MKLNFDTIKSVIRGAVKIDEQDGKLYPRRFTDAQREAYRCYSADFYMKTNASAGIRLEFYTDSKALSLSGEAFPGSSRNFFGFDVYSNGALVCHEIFTMSNGYAKYTVNANLGDGEGKRIIVYFPWSAEVNISELSIDDGATVTPTKRLHNMICFGDSITHGYDAINPSFSYANRLADALSADHINKAIGGEVFFPALAELCDEIKPDYITVAYGTNDWSKNPKESFDRDSRLFYEKLSKSYPDAKIFALAPVWRINCETRITSVGEFTYVAKTLREIADSLKGVTFIDCIDFIPHDKDYYVADVLHPNDAGFYHYAMNLASEIKKHI